MHVPTILLGGRGAVAVALLSLVLAACDQGKVHQNRAEEIVDAAMAEHPEDPAAGAQDALAALQSEFKAAIQAESQQVAAAMAFAGYYGKNLYAMNAICVENDVPLTNYSAAFTAVNAGPYQVASRHVDLPAVIASGKQSDLETAKRELNQIAALQKSDVRRVCSFMEENGREVAADAAFSKAMPEIHAILLGGA